MVLAYEEDAKSRRRAALSAHAAKSGALLTIAAIVVAALNLRPALAALGPVLDTVKAATGASSAAAGLLTTLPIFLMGLGALLAAPLRRMLGERMGVAAGLLAIALACALRAVWPSLGGLFVSAAVVGIGVAAVQALTPGFIKRFAGDDAARLTGLYTTGIMAGAAVAAASASGLTRLAGWQTMFGLWAAPAVLALLLWMGATQRSTIVAPAGGSAVVRRHALWKTPRAWLLLAFFGVGTGAYTLVLAWFPPFYASRGLTADQAGYALSALTVCEVLAGLTVSAAIARRPDRRPPLVAALTALLAGIACLLLAPWLVLPAVCLLGAGIGAIFPLSLIVTLDHAADPDQAGDLMAFVQGGGYVMASVMPFLAGWVRDASSDLSGAWLLMAFGVVAMMAMTTRFRPDARVG
ncbi:MAG: MFS transporter [Caulobacter sp.]